MYLKRCRRKKSNQKKNFIKTEKAFHDRLDCLATWPSYISIQPK
jgi:hypothetical protein